MTNGKIPKCAPVLSGAAGPPSLVPSALDVAATDHLVQFYEQEEFFVDTLAQYIGSGLGSGGSAIVIATREHRAALEAKLQARCLDIETLRAQGHYFPLDAAETLASFMDADAPDPVRFEAAIGKVMALAARDGRRVWAFGEMVALLCAEGRTRAALALESLWNDLARQYTFSLLCAYPLRLFAGAADAERFHAVCCAHTRVIPAESYSAQTDDDGRLRLIAELQRKATTLEAEVDERRRAEARAREQHTKLSLAATLARLGIWEFDFPTNTLACSDQCRSHFGLSAEEPVAYATMVQRIHAADRERVETELQRATTAGGHAVEFRVTLPDGSQRWLASIARLLGPGSRRVLGVTQDITDQRQQAELLERTVAERTLELQATVEELEAFSYSISHDMRAPLRSIQGFAGVLLKDLAASLDAENRRHLERIVAAGERMDRLIQDVLKFSRVTRAELTLEPVNLDHVVRGILECYPNLQPPHASIRIEGTLPAVLGNAAAITQCISNLLGNAVKFMHPGTEPIVRIWAETMAGKASDYAPGSQSPFVRVCVRDNGIGIPADAREKIFGIFQRLGRNYEGTGIGLAIVKKAAERMGGSVGVESEAGQGSTFWLDLPAVAPT